MLLRPCLKDDIHCRGSKLKRIINRVAWADEVGGELISEEIRNRDDLACLGRRVKEAGEDFNTVEQNGVRAQFGSKAAHPPEKRTKGGWGHQSLCARTYKEAVLSRRSQQLPQPQLHLHHPTSSSAWSTVQRRTTSSTEQRQATLQREGRCFRCFSREHRAAACRDPVWCLSCGHIGHRARRCKRPTSKGVEGVTMNLLREHRRRGRPACAKAFIPVIEEYSRRLELRRNAMLLDVEQPADLGLAPQQTLANALARRFGGYSHDFYVARYRERDFVVILPGWVAAETLLRQHLLTLDGI